MASSEAGLRGGSSRIEEAGCKSHGQRDIRVRECLSSAVTTILLVCLKTFNAMQRGPRKIKLIISFSEISSVMDLV